MPIIIRDGWDFDPTALQTDFLSNDGGALTTEKILAGVARTFEQDSVNELFDMIKTTPAFVARRSAQ